MNSSRSFLERARGLAQLGALSIATLGLLVACGNDTPLPIDDGRPTARGGASHTGAAGKPGKAGTTSSNEDAGAMETGDAGEGNTPGAGGMQSGSAGGTGGLGSLGGKGGMGGTLGTGTAGGSGAAGSSQGGSGGAKAVCGNNKLEAGEECDDGNTTNWDGCSSTCKSKCEQCEKESCVQPKPTREATFLNCLTDRGGISNPASGNNLAQQGPAQGQPKQKLCIQLVECIRRTNCAQDGAGGISKGCFCGSASVIDCANPQKGPNGPCVDEVGAAAESMSLTDVSQRETKGQYAIGMATTVGINCDTNVCPSECMKSKDISACERCTFADGGNDPFVTFGSPYYNCYFQPTLKCASSTGPTSTCPATTCAPAADCALATHCAENGVTNCYGTTGQGPCAAQFAAATGSTDPATVLDRLTNGGDYASSVLVGLLETERADTCKSTCFPGSGGSGGGGAGGGASAGTGG